MYIATMSVKDNRTYVIWETLESEQEEIYNIVNESVGDPELFSTSCNSWKYYYHNAKSL